MRDAALRRIKQLDCDNPDKKLASCDPSAAPPREVKDWQQILKKASVDDRSYQKALASTLENLICKNPSELFFGNAGAQGLDGLTFAAINAAPIVRGLIRNGRLKATGPNAPALVDFIMSNDCVVGAALTDDDKVDLLTIKQDAEKEFPPSSASK